MHRISSALTGLAAFLLVQSVSVAAPGTATDSITISEDVEVFTQLILEGNVGANNWTISSNGFSTAGFGSFGEFVIGPSGGGAAFVIMPGADAVGIPLSINSDSRVEIGTAPFSLPFTSGNPLTLTDSLSGLNQPSIHFNTTHGVWGLWADSGALRIFNAIDGFSGGTSFLISTGAPDWALAIDSTGYVGMGTQEPTAKLHVWGDSSDETDVQVLVENLNTADPGKARALFTIKNDGPARFSMWASLVEWVFNARADGFRISKQGTGELEMEVSDTGNLTVSGSVTEGSSRTIKTDIVEVDSTEILDKVVSLPVTRWSYTRDADGTRHLGPMAEDFYEAFELGHTNKGIASVDGSGVALAAIQGLKQEKDAEIAKLAAEKDAQIANLQAELHQLRTEQEDRMMQLEMVVAELLQNQSPELQVGSAN